MDNNDRKDSQTEEMYCMVKEMYGYIFSDKFVKRKCAVRMTPTQVREILNIPNTTFYRWIKFKLLPRRKDALGYYFIATEVDEAIISGKIKCDPRAIEEFRRNYIYDA